MGSIEGLPIMLVGLRSSHELVPSSDTWTPGRRLRSVSEWPFATRGGGRRTAKIMGTPPMAHFQNIVWGHSRKKVVISSTVWQLNNRLYKSWWRTSFKDMSSDFPTWLESFVHSAVPCGRGAPPEPGKFESHDGLPKNGQFDGENMGNWWSWDWEFSSISDQLSCISVVSQLYSVVSQL